MVHFLLNDYSTFFKVTRTKSKNVSKFTQIIYIDFIPIMTTGSEAWGKTPESLWASVSSSVGDHQDPHLALWSLLEFPLPTT